MTDLAQNQTSAPTRHRDVVDFVCDSGPSTTIVVAMSPDAEDWADCEFTRISREYLGVWLFSPEAAREVVQELLDQVAKRLRAPITKAAFRLSRGTKWRGAIRDVTCSKIRAVGLT